MEVRVFRLFLDICFCKRYNHTKHIGIIKYMLEEAGRYLWAETHRGQYIPVSVFPEPHCIGRRSGGTQRNQIPRRTQ